MEFLKDLLIRIAIPLVAVLAVWGPIALSICQEGRKFAEQLDGLNYELRQPKFMRWLGVICAILFLVPVVIVPATGNETFTIGVALGFFAFAALGAFLAVYAIQWRITVQNNRLIVRMPFKAEKEMRIDDITTVKEKYNGIIAYINKKKVFHIENQVIGFELLCAQLYEAGKMESTQQKNSFAVKAGKGVVILGAVFVLLSGGFLIWTIFWSDETVNWLVYISLAGFNILPLYLLINALRWRLTIENDTLFARNMVGKEKSYSINSITRVSIKKENIIICIGEKKIAKVAVGCNNFPILIERLNSEKIPFYEKGKSVE